MRKRWTFVRHFLIRAAARLEKLSRTILLAIIMLTSVGWLRSYFTCDTIELSRHVAPPTYEGVLFNPPLSPSRQFLKLDSSYGGLRMAIRSTTGGFDIRDPDPPPDGSMWALHWQSAPDHYDYYENPFVARPSKLRGLYRFTFGPPTTESIGFGAVSTIVVRMPHWFVLLALSAIAWYGRARAMLARRRAMREACCLNCGYDLRATPERCPECGKAAHRVTGSIYSASA